MNTKELLCDVMYKMYKTGTLDECETEHFEVMWRGLIDYLDIYITDLQLELFIDEINCKKSDDYDWFKKTFNKYFI